MLIGGKKEINDLEKNEKSCILFSPKTWHSRHNLVLKMNNDKKFLLLLLSKFYKNAPNGD